MHVKSPDLRIRSKWLQMTASAIITNNNYCWLKINNGFINLFYCHKSTDDENMKQIEIFSSRGVKGGAPPPFDVKQFDMYTCVNTYSRSLIWPRSIFFIYYVSDADFHTVHL